MADIEKVFFGRFKEQKTQDSVWTPVPEERMPKPRYTAFSFLMTSRWPPPQQLVTSCIALSILLTLICPG